MDKNAEHDDKIRFAMPYGLSNRTIATGIVTWVCKPWLSRMVTAIDFWLNERSDHPFKEGAD